MPRLSVYFIRTALVYLLVGSTFGGLILANKGIPFLPILWVLLPIHIEVLFSGWMMELVMGVAFWILPRFSSGAPRGNEWFSWLSYICLNGGILLLAIETFKSNGWMAPVGKSLIWVAALFFLAGNWKRIKPSGA